MILRQEETVRTEYAVNISWLWGIFAATMDMPSVESEPFCYACKAILVEPYIQCVGCPTQDTACRPTICLHCFAKGVEFDSHESSHSYSIVKNNFPVFEKTWTAMEEHLLLKAIAECGYGNWADISQHVRTKTPSDCQHHYDSCYINSPEEPLPQFPEAKLDFFPCPVVYKLCEDPPRSSEGSIVSQEMAGYMAGRGDFMTEYMNFIELDLRSVDFSHQDEPLIEELKFAAVEAYQRCIKERWRRKRLISRHGLINIRKNAGLWLGYSKSLGLGVERLRVFTQLLSPESHDTFMESLHYEHELRNEIRHLQEYRTNGLKKLRHIQLFRMLKKKRDSERRNRNLLNDVITHMKDETACQTWLQRQATLDSLGKGITSNLPSTRRPAPPLEIAELPGYDKLSVKEKELCSTIRLVPSAYLEFKSLLQAECLKQGALKLAQARLLIKIDVNKTRKIYDFLVTEGIIIKDG